MNAMFVAFVQRHWAHGVDIDPETWPTLEEALTYRCERESMLQQIWAAWDMAPEWQSHALLTVEGDFAYGRWESGSGRGLLEFHISGTWAGGGGSTDYATELAPVPMTLAEAAKSARKAMKGMYIGESSVFLRKAEEKLLALQQGEVASFYGLPFGTGSNPNEMAECHIRRVDGGYRREVSQ